MKGEYYNLNDKDKEAQQFHALTFEEIDDIGFDLLDKVLSGDVIDDHLIPIRSILYRLLEMNDTLSIMVHKSLISTAFPITRYEFEVLAQLSYMLSDNVSVSDKSMMYYYCDIRQRFLNHDKKHLDDYMNNSKLFKNIHSKVSNVKNKEKMSWYSLYEGKKTTLSQLCKKVGLHKHYSILYPHLSSDVHGTSCLEANTKCFEDGGKYYLRNLRLFERHHSVMIQHIDFMRRAFVLFLKIYDVPQEPKEKIIDFYRRSNEYIDTYWSIKGSAIDPLADFSM